MHLICILISVESCGGLNSKQYMRQNLQQSMLFLKMPQKAIAEDGHIVPSPQQCVFSPALKQIASFSVEQQKLLLAYIKKPCCVENGFLWTLEVLLLWEAYRNWASQQEGETPISALPTEGTNSLSGLSLCSFAHKLPVECVLWNQSGGTITQLCCAVLQLSGRAVMGTRSALPKAWVQAKSYTTLAISLNSVLQIGS